jgi:myo-inositol-1(or 4)-monophosphatase
MSIDVEARQRVAVEAARLGAELALQHYRGLDALVIEQKGHQDLVSNADREVEQLIRRVLIEHYPDDGVIGEEYDNKPSDSGFSWVIDPIDGTASFVRGRPGWCVVIAGVYQQQTVTAVVHDIIANEVFDATKEGGARLNAKPLSPSTSQSLGDGAVGVGFNHRVPAELCLQPIRELVLEHQGVFYQNGSGALMLAYVASGRLIGYVEPHMNAWDCLASLLIIEEAGGVVQPFNHDTMLQRGGRVVAACAGVYTPLTQMVDQIYGDFSL